MASSHQYRGKPQRKEATLPPYEPPSPTNPMSFYSPVPTPSAIAYSPVPTPSAIAHVEPQWWTPKRGRSNLLDYLYGPRRTLSGDLATCSGDSMGRAVTTIMDGYSNTGNSMFGGPMHAQPETIASPVSPTGPLPRSYSASVKPMLLWLDGGGTKAVLASAFGDAFRLPDTIKRQHTGPDSTEAEAAMMLGVPGYQTIDKSVGDTVSQQIRTAENTASGDPLSFYDWPGILQRNFSNPEQSDNQTQDPAITPAERRAPEFEAFNDTPSLSFNGSPPDQHAHGEASRPVRGWSVSTGPPSMYLRPSSSLKATSTRTPTSRTPQHRQCLDVWFYRRCPENLIDALNTARQFRDAYGADQPIPDELIDELLEPTGDGKYIFCCQRGQKPRNKTGARDHVRKLLGNFPFCCPNLGCEHSSLRRADLNKHKKSCKFPLPSFSPTVSWEVQNLEFLAPDLHASASLTPQEQNTTVDTDALLDMSNAGEDIMDSYLTFPPLGGDYEAGIDAAE